tara:strand:- start:56 stop:472 length:417 start_codon:yes stop_codon:yes gene_type:complete
MSKNWSKEDKTAWANSEVMQELEKQVTKNIKTVRNIADNIVNKSAADANQMREMQGAAESLTDSLKDLKDAKVDAFSAADDGVVSSDLIDDASDEDDSEDVRASIISELRELAKSATDKRNIKLAYRIERTIEEILGL